MYSKSNRTKDLPGGDMPFWGACIIVVMAAVFPYLNTLGNEFVTYDDHSLILENETIRELSADSVGGMMSAYVPGAETDVNLPLTALSWAVNYRLHGYSVWGYHAGNIALYALACVMLLALLRLGPWGRGVALWAVLLFAVHPAHVEAVAWLSARKEPLSALFLFAALAVFVGFVRAQKRAVAGGALLLSLALWGCALLAKPMAVTMPGLALVWLLIVEKRILWRRGLAGLAVFAAAGAVFVWTQMQVLAGREVVAEHLGGSFAMTQMTTGYVLLRYAGLLLAPVNLSTHYIIRVPDGFTDPLYAGSWLAVFVAGSVLLITARRRPGVLFYPAWFLVSLLPVLHIIQFRAGMADRYLYVASVAYCLGAAAAAAGIRRSYHDRRPFAATLVTVVLLAAVALFAFATVQRNRVWRDSETLWADTVSKNPFNTIALNNLGSECEERGELEQAKDLYVRAIKADPDHFVPYENLGTIYGRGGDYGRAAEYLEKVQELEPDIPRVLQKLSMSYVETGRPEQAMRAAGRMLERRPDSLWANQIMCRALLMKRETGRAVDYCGVAARAAPGDLQAATIHANSLFLDRRYAEAASIYSRLAVSHPSAVPVWINLGLCRYMQGDKDEAAKLWRQALKLDPYNEKARKYLEQMGDAAGHGETPRENSGLPR